MSTSRSQRRAWARSAARRGHYTPFPEFVRIPQLIADPYLDGKQSYLQAASLIAFLIESRPLRDRFPRFLESLGSVRRDDSEGIDAAVREVYDLDLAGLEAEWVRYWSR